MPESNPRPPTSRTHRRVIAGIFVVTAWALAWVGWILQADAADAMDGVQRLVFTVVPVRPFAWIMSVVFLAMGLWLLFQPKPPPSDLSGNSPR